MNDSSNTAEPSLRERKKSRTRRDLIDTALTLFLENGFYETTLDQLVDAVEVSKRTFFRNFTSKEDVAMAAEVELWLAYEQHVRELAETGNVLELLRRALFSTLADMPPGWVERFFTTRGLVARTPALWNHSLALAASTQRDIADALAPRLGVGTDDLALRLACEIAFSAYRCGAKNWISDRKRRGRARLIDTVDAAFDAVPAGLELSIAP